MRNHIAFALLVAGCLCMGDDMRGITLGAALVLSAVILVSVGRTGRKARSRR